MYRIFLKILDIQSRRSYQIVSFFIGFCFLLGALAGSFFASAFGGGDISIENMDAYISVSRAPIISVLVSFFSYPLIVFICGFCVFGAAIIPIIIIFRGFLLSFAVTMLVRLFGGGGLLFSLSLFAIYCITALPCLFILSSQAMISASSLFSVACGKGRKLSEQIFSKSYFLRTLFCAGILIAGALLEIFMTPYVSELVARNVIGI